MDRKLSTYNDCTMELYNYVGITSIIFSKKLLFILIFLYILLDCFQNE